jgi:hypothetical protein
VNEDETGTLGGERRSALRPCPTPLIFQNNKIKNSISKIEEKKLGAYIIKQNLFLFYLIFFNQTEFYS